MSVKPMSFLISVSAPHFCASLILVKDNARAPGDFVCTEAAPILRWALGKPWRALRRYFRSKGYAYNVQPDPSPKVT